MSGMADAIVRLVDARDWVTFAELENNIEGFGGGERALGLGGRQDFLWFGLTVEGAEAAMAVMRERRVAVAASSTLTYLIDGRVPDVPVVKDRRRHKTARWVPVCLRPARHGNVLLPNGVLFHDPKIRRKAKAA